MKDKISKKTKSIGLSRKYGEEYKGLYNNIQKL